VAALAATAARAEGLPAEAVDAVRHAGLLHDLGRVAISGGVWDKATPLTDAEREKIRLHSYVGERLLSRAPAFARISEITSLTHERLDGSGYHRRVAAAAVPPEARILAAADVYQALVEDRPHRKAYSAEGAVAQLKTMVEAGALCPDATRAVLAAAGHAPPKLDRVAGLTARQVEVLRLLARGLTNKEIASALDISTKTAGHHVQHIFGKLGVTTRSGAAIHAMKFGITA
jgi:HD-GYP domain-containing protein (c-di-GMP phosphodiesterase class II)